MKHPSTKVTKVTKKGSTDRTVKRSDTKVQADRHNIGKPKLSYMLDFPNAMAAHARICEGGAENYDKHNWKKGLPYTEVEDSLLRHQLAFHNCEDNDSESKQLHMGHVMWNAMALIEFHADPKKSKIFDDRDHANNTTK